MPHDDVDDGETSDEVVFVMKEKAERFFQTRLLVKAGSCGSRHHKQLRRRQSGTEPVESSATAFNLRCSSQPSRPQAKFRTGGREDRYLRSGAAKTWPDTVQMSQMVVV